MDVVLDRLARRLLGRLEQGADVDVEADVGERGRDHLGAAVVAVLAELGDQEARPAALGLGERLDLALDGHELRILLEGAAIDACDRAHLGPPAAEDALHGRRDLAERGARARRLDAELEQIGIARGTFGQRLERGLAAALVAPGPHLGEAFELRLAHRRRVDVEQLDRMVLGRPVLVDPDHDLLAPVPGRLTTGGRGLDLGLGHAGLDRPGHAAHGLDLVDQRRGRPDQARRQLLDVVAAAERVDDVPDAGLLGQDQLGVAGDPGRAFGRQGQRLIEGVGVQRLGAAEHRGQRLDRGPDDVVVDVLRLQGDAAGLAMGAQHQRARVLGLELALHELCP